MTRAVGLETFVSRDEARPHMATPFGVTLGGHTWDAATDGHRVALVRIAAYATYTWRANAPALDAVFPTSVVPLGVLRVDALEALQYVARVGDASYVVVDDTDMRLYASRTVGPKSKRRLVPIFLGALVAGGARLELGRFGVNVSYLVDAVAFLGGAEVHVWRADAYDELAPVVFTASSSEPLDCARVVVQMPVRI